MLFHFLPAQKMVMELPVPHSQGRKGKRGRGRTKQENSLAGALMGKSTEDEAQVFETPKEEQNKVLGRSAG